MNRQELKDTIARRVAEGFDRQADIVESAMDAGEEKPDKALVKKMITDAFAAHKKAQTTWRGRTDCDRLDAAFDDLEKDGIVARQNFTCCQSCGSYEIGDEIDAAKKKGAVIGYTFYHQQDTESAADGCGLYLLYGALKAKDAKRVAKAIVGALKGAGLKTTWDGDLGTRILVEMNWKKRR